jgi:hypothetical protein
MKRFFSWVLPRKRPASSTPQYPNARPTTATDVPSINVSRHLLVSPSQGTSCVVDRPSTVPGPTGTGEYIGHASCIVRHQPGSQIISFSLETGHQAILHRI